MLTDVLANADLYAGLGARLTRALDFLRTTDFNRLGPGRIDLDGADLYAIVSDYVTKPESEGRWEAHRRYIDLQYVARGVERIGVCPLGSLQSGEYDTEKDVTWLTGRGDFITLSETRFIVLWPGDAHMPGIAVDVPGDVRKVVVKIAVTSQPQASRSRSRGRRTAARPATGCSGG